MTGAAPPSSREYGIAVSFGMRTVAETPVFVRYAAEVWSDTERQEFISFIAANPESGDVIRGTGGCRKVRWSRSGTGKRGGARVIYFLAPDATVWLLIVYDQGEVRRLARVVPRAGEERG